MWLRQGELHHVGERALLQLVAVQGQELLELTAHIAVLKEEKKEKSVDLFKEKYKEFHQKLDFKRKGFFFYGCSFFLNLTLKFLPTNLYLYVFFQAQRNKSSL